MSTTTTVPTQQMDGEAHDTLTLGATASAQGFGRPVPLPPDTALPLVVRCQRLCDEIRAICQRSAHLRQESTALLVRSVRLRSETAALLQGTRAILSVDDHHDPEL